MASDTNDLSLNREQKARSQTQFYTNEYYFWLPGTQGDTSNWSLDWPKTQATLTSLCLEYLFLSGHL